MRFAAKFSLTFLLFRTYSTEYACSDGTQTPSSEVDCEFPDPFQTEKLLKTSIEIESEGENIFNAFVKVSFVWLKLLYVQQVFI